MIVRKYGITLERLREKDTELVRKHRNDPWLASHMEYREHISPDMQKEWFASIDNFNNFYFLIIYEGKKIGLINSSDIKWEEISSKGGIFIWDREYIETYIPVLASLLLLETNFTVFRAKQSYIKTLKDNPRAIGLNKSLGYKILPGQDDVYNQEYVMSAKDFRSNARRLSKAARIISNNAKEPYCMCFDEKDIANGLADFMESKMDKSLIIDKTISKGQRRFIFAEAFD